MRPTSGVVHAYIALRSVPVYINQHNSNFKLDARKTNGVNLLFFILLFFLPVYCLNYVSFSFFGEKFLLHKRSSSDLG